MQNDVKKFSRFKEIDNPTVIANVQTNLAEEVNKVAEQFKQQNKQYLIKLKQRTKKFDDCFTQEGEEGVYSLGFDETQLNMLTESEDMVNQRVAEIKKIAKNFKNYRIILACRNLTKANARKEEIEKETQNKNLIVMEIDTSSLDSVKNFVEKYKKSSYGKYIL